MTWQCPTCTLENRSEQPHCQACLSENPALARKTTSSTSGLFPEFISKPVSGLASSVKGFLSSAVDAASRVADKAASPAYATHDFVILPNGPIVPDPIHPKPPSPVSALTSPYSPYNLNHDPGPSSSREEVRNFDENVVWTCTACTSENKGSAQKCSICGTQRTVGSKRHARRSKFYLHASGEESNSMDESNSYSKSLNPDSEEFKDKMCSDITEVVMKRDREKAEKLYKNIVEGCRALRVSFVDPDFQQSNKSIGELRSDDEGAIVGHVPDKFIWLRPSQLYTKDGRAFPWTVFNDPRPSDIEQGALGDCWLLSAMALIAERPDILSEIVLTKQYSQIGVYQVRVCVDGEWRTVTVDDYFPCNAHSMSLAFAKSRKNQLWVPLIEKALAKHMGSYSKLRGGRTIEGLAMLTGAPCETECLENKHADKEILWAKLISAHEASFIMGCSCGSGRREVNGEEYKRMGLLTRHAYSILDVRQEREYRLLHVRNPWGTFVWKGAWSDAWPNWPGDLRRRLLSRENHSAGAFWMSFDDFLRYFDSVDIAKVRTHAGWSELRVPLYVGGFSNPKDQIVQLIITEPTEINLSLFQKGARTTDDQMDLLVCLHKVSQHGRVSDLVARSEREIHAFVGTGDVFLKPGQYVALCHSYKQLTSGKRTRANLSISSSRPVYADMLMSVPAMLGDSLVEMVLKDGKIHYTCEGVLIRYVTRTFNGLIIMADNTHSNTWAHVKVTCEGSTNVVSSRSTLKVADVVPPLSRQIIILLTQLEPTQGYNLLWNTSVRLTNKLYLGDYAQPELNGLVDKSSDHTPKINGNRTIHELHMPRTLFT